MGSARQVLQTGVMEFEFIVEDDDTITPPALSGWETVVFEVGDVDDAVDDDIAGELEELIVALYF
jgi:hypothetical protein